MGVYDQIALGGTFRRTPFPGTPHSSSSPALGPFQPHPAARSPWGEVPLSILICPGGDAAKAPAAEQQSSGAPLESGGSGCPPVRSPQRVAPLALGTLGRGLPDHIPGLEGSLGAPGVQPPSRPIQHPGPPRKGLLGTTWWADSCLVPTHQHRVCPGQLTACRQPWGDGSPRVGDASLQNMLSLLRPGFFPL